MDFVGINYGRLASNPLPHNVAIEKIKSIGAKAIKLFDTDTKVLENLRNSGLRVMTAIPNGELEKYAHDSHSCMQYAKTIRSFLDQGVQIEWVAVGNELTAFWYKDKYTMLLMPTLIKLRDAFASQELSGRVKLVVPPDLSILSISYPPSASEFRPELVPLMKDILYFLRNNGNAPFVVNQYAMITKHENPDIPLPFALLDSRNQGYDDAGRHYSNLFEAQVNAVYHAIAKVGYATDNIMIGECGWASAGCPVAGEANAQTFLTNFLEVRKRGTPCIRKPIPAFIFAFIDENQKDTSGGHTEFERYWGLFREDGRPKFSLRLT
jgi:exo-beta-1,3-glucanase (GH17 family)